MNGSTVSEHSGDFPERSKGLGLALKAKVRKVDRALGQPYSYFKPVN